MFEAKSQCGLKGFLFVVLTLMRMKIMLFKPLKRYRHKSNKRRVPFKNSITNAFI